VVFDDYRSFVEIPFVSFSFGYWDRHYRDRPWFEDWDHWHHADQPRRPRRNIEDNGGEGTDENWKEYEDGTVRRERRRGQNDDMRCGTDDPDPSCPGNSRGRRMQMED
jgi:hypothetical protein